MSNIVKYMKEMTLEQLSNPDGTFNKECVTFEEYRDKWLKGSDYENETEIAQRRVYANTIKRLHTCYRGLKEKNNK